MLYHISNKKCRQKMSDTNYVMMSNFQLFRPIPWQHQGDEMTTLWLWETEHFTVTITGNINSVYFRINDKSTNQMFFDGQARAFEEAEMVIRETIGKAYHPSLGYTPYAGSLMTTFVLADGDKKDLGRFVDRAVLVKVLNANGSQEEYKGVAKIVNYYLELHTEKVHIKILPSHIIDITPVLEVEGIDAEYERISGRIFKGNHIAGCTGSPGFMPNTIEHNGIPCPIHERKSR
jgi:hypothetical protein